MFPCVTHPCATLIISCKHYIIPVQLACVKPAASVRSEPGSNSHIKFAWPRLITHKESSWFLYLILRQFVRIFILPSPSAYPLCIFTLSYNYRRLRILFAYSLYLITTGSSHICSSSARWFIWHSSRDVNNFFWFFFNFCDFFPNHLIWREIKLKIPYCQLNLFPLSKVSLIYFLAKVLDSVRFSTFFLEKCHYFCIICVSHL